LKTYPIGRIAVSAPLIALLLLVGCAAKPVPMAVEADAFQSIIETLSAPQMEGRDAGTDGLVLARTFLVDRLIAAGLEPAFVIDGEPSYTQPFELKIGTDEDGGDVMAPVHNVGAVLPGSGDLAGQVVVVGGHYDHIGYGHIGSRAPDQEGEIHPGADDNASGTAGVILLADYFANQAAAATTNATAEPRRTVLFTCFSGEERGLRGSRYMTAHPEQWAFDNEQVVAMINMDMIGRLRDGDLYLFGDESGEQWRSWVNRANRRVGLDLQWGVRAPGGSDHSPFIASGVPSVFLNTWLHEDYHRPSDTADKINAQGGAQVLTLAALVIDEVATTRDRLDYTEPVRRPRPSLGVAVGNDERGVFLRSVVDDGPMQQAGALADDVILSIDDRPIATIYDFNRFILSADPGDEAEFELLRAGQPVELTIRLGER